MEKLHIEGVVIRVFPFREYDRILSLFTPQEGLIKFVVKGAFTAKMGKGSHTTPLNLVEAIYTQGKNELHACREMTLIEPHHSLRQNLPTLEAACDMLKTIESTQYPGKAVPELYALFRAYLKRLPEAVDPAAISTSFRLKTLRHEGLLSELELFPMNTEERQLLEVLALCRDFSLLAKLSIEPAFVSRIHHHLWAKVDGLNL